MKVGILGSRGIPNQYGGFEQFAGHLALGLLKRGVEVWVYCSDSHPIKNTTWNGINRILCRDPEDKIGRAGQFFYDFNCINDSRKRNFDIIYQLGYTSNSVWFRRLPDGPAVVTNMDGLEWKRSKYSPLVRRFLKYAEKLAVISSDALIADSKEIAKHLRTVYNANSTFIPYGAELFENPNEDSVKNEGLKPFNYHLLIARMQPDNHIEEIIQGVINSNTDTPLLVVGNTDNSFGKYLMKNYRDDKIKFGGAIFNKDLLNNLRHFSTLYFHGHSAGGTNPSLLEAMAANAWICAHDNQFNREVLRENAFYFKSSDDITNILNHLETKESLRNKFTSINRKTIEEKYNWESIIERYHAFFNELL